ncbi:MAG: hypothetical protein JJ992_05905 [Planctomycetes bacterium]|nr:hypothetical protein [Planctomycetota bacterium]
MLAATMAQEQRAPLRIISRLAPPEPSALDEILAEHGLSYAHNPSFDYLSTTGRGPVIGMTTAERIVVGGWEDARLALQLVSADRMVYLIDQAEAPVLVRNDDAQRLQDLFHAQRSPFVFADAGVRDALSRAGLFGDGNSGESALVLVTTPRGLDWQRIAGELLEGTPSS